RAQWEIRAIAWKMLEEVKRVHPTLFRYAGPNCIIHENFIREEPITLEDEKEFVSQRCIEGVPRQGIWKCIRNSQSILNKR
ncbi:MAG: FAD-dependent thymidylate synthase, partial [Metallosphaera sp.]